MRASVSQSKLYALLPACADIASTVVAYPSAGVAHVVMKPDATADVVTSLRKRCVDAGGALVIERGPLELKRSAGVWGEPRGDFALMQRLKAELDPKRCSTPAASSGASEAVRGRIRWAMFTAFLSVVLAVALGVAALSVQRRRAR